MTRDKGSWPQPTTDWTHKLASADCTDTATRDRLAHSRRHRNTSTETQASTHRHRCCCQVTSHPADKTAAPLTQPHVRCNKLTIMKTHGSVAVSARHFMAALPECSHMHTIHAVCMLACARRSCRITIHAETNHSRAPSSTRHTHACPQPAHMHVAHSTRLGALPAQAAPIPLPTCRNGVTNTEQTSITGHNSSAPNRWGLCNPRLALSEP